MKHRRKIAFTETLKHHRIRGNADAPSHSLTANLKSHSQKSPRTITFAKLNLFVYLRLLVDTRVESFPNYYLQLESAVCDNFGR